MSEARRIPLDEFGEAFVTHVVTPERIRTSLEKAAGRPFEVGPLKPIGMVPVTVRGSGKPGAVSVRRADSAVQFEAEIRVSTELVITIAGIDHRYAGDIAIRLRMHVVFEEPLTLVVEIDRPRRGDIDVGLSGDSSRAELLKVVGNVSGEVGREVARIVNQQVDSERGRAARRIDLAGAVDKAWAAIGAR